jgi:hypothetical protein
MVVFNKETFFQGSPGDADLVELHVRLCVASTVARAAHSAIRTAACVLWRAAPAATKGVVI